MLNWRIPYYLGMPFSNEIQTKQVWKKNRGEVPHESCYLGQDYLVDQFSLIVSLTRYSLISYLYFLYL